MSYAELQVGGPRGRNQESNWRIMGMEPPHEIWRAGHKPRQTDLEGRNMG